MVFMKPQHGQGSMSHWLANLYQDGEACFILDRIIGLNTFSNPLLSFLFFHFLVLKVYKLLACSPIKSSKCLFICTFPCNLIPKTVQVSYLLMHTIFFLPSNLPTESFINWSYTHWHSVWRAFGCWCRSTHIVGPAGSECRLRCHWSSDLIRKAAAFFWTLRKGTGVDQVIPYR